ncbi:MAG: serine/threonine-protein kinase, partial [Chloroflexota bacterium]
MVASPTLINKRYIVNNMLGQGGMGEVYRATDRLTGQIIALKRVTALANQPNDTPSTDNDFYLALSDEFRTLASIRHPNIISVLDYGFEDKQPYFTMELLETPQTILEAAHDTPLSKKIELLIEVLQALVYLHRRGVLHRDLKPGNILVNQAGVVKVLDFGLSLAGTNSRSNIHTNTVGTIAYMAPELFADEPASIASDLYAVGVIACELLTEQYPFNQKNIALLINGILSSLPDLTGLDDEMAAIVGRLLSKEPQNRYASATDVIHDLCLAADQPAPIESSAVRESFLQAAKFTGRTQELQLLKVALDKTVKMSLDDDSTDLSSRMWLVGGESGVGKSRLLDEIRIRALVRGALVLRGQAITEGSIPYQVWRDQIRRLALSVDLNDDAPVLKSLLPDIDMLLERSIPEPPSLDPQMSQHRFIRVVTDMFRALQQPTVVILEDLHWASDENLELLKRVIPLTRELPILIIASYRDDERPKLSSELS